MAAKKVAVRNEVAEVEAMLKEVEEPAVAGSSVAAVREVVAADSVADSHLGSRQANSQRSNAGAETFGGGAGGFSARSGAGSGSAGRTGVGAGGAGQPGVGAGGAGRTGAGAGGAGRPGAGAAGAGRPGVGVWWRRSARMLERAARDAQESARWSWKTGCRCWRRPGVGAGDAGRPGVGVGGAGRPGVGVEQVGRCGRALELAAQVGQVLELVAQANRGLVRAA